MRASHGEAVTGPGVQLHDFGAQLIFHLENHPREIGGVFQLRNHHAFDVDAEALKHVREQIVRERTFLGGITQEIADHLRHVGLDLNDENLFVVAEENGCARVGRHYAANLNQRDIRVHKRTLRRARPIDKPERERQDGRLNFHDKILTQSSLTEWRAAQRAAGRTVAVTNGCFDILHAGHVEYLQAARNEADSLLVGLNSDRSIGELKGPERPIHTETDRAAVLAALTSVDAVAVFDELRATNFLKLAEPDVYVKGGDYTVDELPAEERAVVDALGGRIVVMAHVPGKSTSDIAARIVAG